MPRVSEAEVLVLVPSEQSVAPFIDTATLMVDELLAGRGHSDARLKQIELYLAAHYALLALEGGNVKSEKLGEATTTYAGVFTEGLRLTRYGQQALALDTFGILGKVGTGNNLAEFRVV